MSRPLGCPQNRLREHLGVDPRRARRLHEDRTRTEQIEREVRKTGVSPQRTRHGVSATRERGWIDDDCVEAPAVTGELFHDLERIAGHGLVVDIDGVGSEVPAGGFGGVGRQVGREHGAGASGGGVHREAAVAAEDVEDVTRLGQIAERPSVSSLVEEISGLLAVDRIGGHGVPVFEKGNAFVSVLAEENGAVGSARGRRDRAGQPEDHSLGSETLGQRIDHAAEVYEPRRRIELHNERRTVAIHDETRHTIVLTVQPAQSRDLVIVEEPPATLDRLVDAGSPQIGAH